MMYIRNTGSFTGPFLSRKRFSSWNCPGRCSTRIIRRTLKYVCIVICWSTVKNGDMGSLMIGMHATAFMKNVRDPRYFVRIKCGSVTIWPVFSSTYGLKNRRMVSATKMKSNRTSNDMRICGVLSPDMMNIRIGVMTELYQMTKNMNPSQARRTYESGKNRRAIWSVTLLALSVHASGVGSELVFRRRFPILFFKCNAREELSYFSACY